MIVVKTRPACEQLGYVHNITFGTCQFAGHGDFAPQPVHVAIIFIAICNDEDMVALECDFESVLHYL